MFWMALCGTDSFIVRNNITDCLLRLSHRCTFQKKGKNRSNRGKLCFIINYSIACPPPTHTQNFHHIFTTPASFLLVRRRDIQQRDSMKVLLKRQGLQNWKWSAWTVHCTVNGLWATNKLCVSVHSGLRTKGNLASKWPTRGGRWWRWWW